MLTAADDVRALAVGGEQDELARSQFRADCRKSLFFFTKTVVSSDIKPNLMTARTFKERSDWLQWVVTDHKRGLFEDPRDHVKSYGSTVSIPPWLAIQRADPRLDTADEVARAEAYLESHPSLKGVDGRYAILSAAEPRAADWVGTSMSYWDNNTVLRWAFPELIWPSTSKRDYGKWSNVEYHLPGRDNPTLPGGFLWAAGPGSATRGERLDGLLIDDLLKDDEIDSPAANANACRLIRLSSQLLEVQDPNDPRAGFMLLVTNRTGLDDPNSMVHDEMPRWAIWHRGASRCSVHDFGSCGRRRSDDETDCAATGEPIWPEKHGDLDAIREDKGDDIYFTEWENDPVKRGDLDADLVIPFDLDIRTVAIDGAPERHWCVVIDELRDSTGEIIAAHEIIPIRHLHGHIISIDPAAADEDSAARAAGKTARTSVGWWAYDPATMREFSLDSRTDHWAPDDSIAAIYDQWLEAVEKLRARPRFLCEKVGAQSFVSPAVRHYAQADGNIISRDEFEMFPRGRANKDLNIKRFVGLRLGQRRLYIRRGRTSMVPRIEMRHFPTYFKDWLDQAAQAIRHHMQASPASGRATERQVRRRARRRRNRANAGRTGVMV